MLNQNSDFLFGFQASMTNPNGDPDQENKPRMDYETSTLLVSDARRKRDCRDFLKNKGYQIFVDTIAEKKVPMEKMFEYVVENWLKEQSKIEGLFINNSLLQEKWDNLCSEVKDKKDYGNTYNDLMKEYKKDKKRFKKEKELIEFNNMFLTEIIKKALIDIRIFGSAMAIEGISKTYTGPVQINWGYSLHPVELVKSSTITSIMNDDNSTFGKKHKVHYALIAHYGTINKYSAKSTGMTNTDRDIFRKALVQGLMSNQTDSKQGQDPLFYLEIVYKPDFDGYLGDLRRFLKTDYKEPIRKIDDVIIDFKNLKETIETLKKKNHIEKVVGWMHPFLNDEILNNMPEFESVDLWDPMQTEG